LIFFMGVFRRDAEMILARERVTVHLFILRLNYSKARFVMAIPF